MKVKLMRKDTLKKQLIKNGIFLKIWLLTDFIMVAVF